MHAYPVADEREHDLEGTGCWCEPKVMWSDPDTGEAFPEALIVHNSADGRELIEQAEAIKNSV